MPESPISIAEGIAISTRIPDIASDSMIVVNVDGVIVRTNLQAEFMFGCGSGGMVGQHINILLPEDRREIHKSHLSKYFNHPRQRTMGESLDLKAMRLNNKEEFTVKIELSPFNTLNDVYTLATIRRIDE